MRPNQQLRVELAEVLASIGRLPVEQREVLLLAAVEELKYEEIAAALDVPIGTVMSRLSRAREKLRQMHAEPAVPLASEAARLQPRDPVILTIYGRALMRTGRVDEALVQLRTALREIGHGRVTLIRRHLSMHQAHGIAELRTQ